MNVELIDHMGSDLSVVNAARVSFDKESDYFCCITGNPIKGCWSEDNACTGPTISDKDIKLINYLASHNHWTPFGHIFASFRIKAPLFVARQLGKHQVGLVWNEVSRRYVDSEPEFYDPELWRKRAANVKQGSSDEYVNLCCVDGLDRPDMEEQLKYLMNDAQAVYRRLLELGVCPEQARMVLPQSMYTEWFWSGSVAAFARVVKLRLDPHTQLETRLIAEKIDQLLADQFPHSWKALTNG